MADSSNQSLLIIDDDPFSSRIAVMAGEECGYEVIASQDLAACEDQIRNRQPGIIILDLQMPGLDGVEILRWLSDIGSRSGILLVSGMEHKVCQTAVRYGQELGLSMLGYRQKPVPVDELRSTLRNAHVRDGRITVAELGHTLDQHKLVVYYQPQMTLRHLAGAPPKLEALIRYEQPDGAVLPPGEIIATAERSGLIESLTWQVISQVVDNLKDWSRAGFSPRVAVNLSPMLLDDPGLPDRIQEFLGDRKVDAGMLQFEITESGLPKDLTRSMEILTRLRLKGFNLAMDDFGTGYSSLLQLLRCPFNELKIDQNFVMEMGHNTEAHTMVKASIDLSHSLGLQVCAEGVENVETLEELRKLGCDSVQGYYISAPLAAADVPEFMRSMHDCRQ